MRQRIVKGAAGELRFLPPEAQLSGPPSSTPAPAAVVRNSRGATVLSGVPTVDSVTTVTGSAAEEGTRRVLLDSVAGIAPGRRYLLTTPSGLLVARVVAVDARGVWLAAGLPVTVEGGAAFRGAELVYPVAGGAFSETGLCRVEWTYTLGGVAYARDQAFSVALRLVSATLDPDELPPYLPAEIASLVRPDEQPALLGTIAAAWEEVLSDVEARGIIADRIMDSDRLRVPHLYRTLALLGAGWGTRWKEWADAQAATYSQKLDALISSPTTWVDADDDGTDDDGAEVGTFGSIVMTR